MKTHFNERLSKEVKFYKIFNQSMNADVGCGIVASLLLHI